MAKVIPVTVQNFDSEVMAAADTSPVVLTFSSSQMPECKTYNAMLEKLSSELDFTLGEVDLDVPDNMMFVQTFRIRSLPFVVVLSQGQMADAIQGSLPEDELKKRLSKFFVSDEERELKQIETAVQDGSFLEAKPIIEAALSKKPDDHLKILLARCEIGLGNSDQAKKVLGEIPENSGESSNAKALLDLMDFAIEAVKTDAVEGSAKAYREACLDATRKDFRSALEGFFQIAISDPNFKEGLARKSMLVLFSVLGAKDPLTWEYRSKLNTMLFI